MSEDVNIPNIGHYRSLGRFWKSRRLYEIGINKAWKIDIASVIEVKCWNLSEKR